MAIIDRNIDDTRWPSKTKLVSLAINHDSCKYMSLEAKIIDTMSSKSEGINHNTLRCVKTQYSISLEV